MRFCYVAILAMFLTCCLSAQDTRGAISGVVTDPQGAVIAHATVTVTNTGTNTSEKLTTNSTGFYEARLLQPGSYSVTVDAGGFRQTVRSGLEVRLGQEVLINLQLSVGPSTESVTVTAEAPILETNSVSTGRALSTRDLMDLPVISNDIVVQAGLAAGAASLGQTPYVAQGQINNSSSTYYFQPGGVGSTEWTIDGLPNNGSARRIAFTPTTDMIEEFKVETSNFDASFGHSTGLNLQMNTKSGSNQLHGSAQWMYWNTRWNAAGFFQKQQYYTNIATLNAAGNTAAANALAATHITPGGHSNNWSGTIGGPIVIPKIVNGRNKLFFFFAIGGERDRQPARPGDYNYTVPTAAERGGNFSDLLSLGVQYTVYDPLSVAADPTRASHYVRTPFPGNVIPTSRINNPALSLFNQYMPLPNTSPTNPTAINYIATCQVDNDNMNSLDQRTDYQKGSNDRFSFRWSWSHYIENYGDYTCQGLMATDDTRHMKMGVLNYNHVFGAAMLFDLSVGSSQWFERDAYTGLAAYKPSSVGLPSYMDTRCAGQGDCALPALGFAGYTWYGASTFGHSMNSYPYDRVFTLKSNISRVMGKHTLRAGIDFRDQIHSDVGLNGNGQGLISFDDSYTRKDDDGNAPNSNLGLSTAAFLLGIPTSASADNNASMYYTNWYYGWYGQDNWRVTHNVTVTLGLRMEYEMGPTERFNRAIGNFDPSAQLPIASAAQAAYAANPIAQVPASAFSVVGGNTYVNVNGAPRNTWQNQMMYLPRLSVAYQITPKWVLRAGYGTYYDTININNESVCSPACVSSINQAGYSRTTTTTFSTNFGQTWAVGNPAAGISPMTDPFPVRADGTRFDTPYGNTLGDMYGVGHGYTYYDYDRKHAKVQKWRIGFQRQLSGNIVVEAAYWGQYANDMPVTKRLDALPAQYWNFSETRNSTLASGLTSNVVNPFKLSNFASLATTNPSLYQELSTLPFVTSSTIQVQQLIRQYPQLNGVYESNVPLGRDRINAFEFDFTKRLSKGFNVNASYTWIPLLRERTIMSNEFDSVPTWYESNTGTPRRMTISSIYELPFGKGKALVHDGWASHVVGGWQLTGTLQYQPGGLLSWGNDFYYGPDLSQAALKTALTTGFTQTINQWFNTNAPFNKSSAAGPASYQARIFPQYINGVRAPGQHVVNANLSRNFQIHERLIFTVRVDAQNLQNYSQLSGPDTNPFDTTFGKIQNQTGSINRFFDIEGRIRF